MPKWGSEGAEQEVSAPHEHMCLRVCTSPNPGNLSTGEMAGLSRELPTGLWEITSSFEVVCGFVHILSFICLFNKNV